MFLNVQPEARSTIISQKNLILDTPHSKLWPVYSSLAENDAERLKAIHEDY